MKTLFTFYVMFCVHLFVDGSAVPRAIAVRSEPIYVVESRLTISI